MPVATKACMKSIVSEEIKNLNIGLILTNTYHNEKQPGK